jgi:SAM-dependent methyltransferase
VSLISNVFFRLMYRLGFTPWDSGVPPPELIEVIEGQRRLRPGTALDIGCGTGTTSSYMALKGWHLTAVDFVPRPIRTARAKAAAAGVSVAFLVGDVTRLHALPIEPGFDLLFDQGCFIRCLRPRNPRTRERSAGWRAPGPSICSMPSGRSLAGAHSSGKACHRTTCVHDLPISSSSRRARGGTRSARTGTRFVTADVIGFDQFQGTDPMVS